MRDSSFIRSDRTEALRPGWNEIELNGARQWVSIRGDTTKPLLLFLHGGPGGAEYGPRRHYLSALEQTWCVVDWDQRGAGRSFQGDEDAASLSMDTLVSDGAGLISLLRTQFPDRSVVVVGHSFGSVLGLLLTRAIPTQIDAYVGASQVVNWARQEKRSYRWALDQAERTGNRRALTALKAIDVPDRSGVYEGGTASVEVQRRWLGALGGVSADPRFIARWTMTILLARDYPLSTKLRFTKGMRRSMDLIWPELGERIDFQRDIDSLEVPVYLFAGSLDRITDLDQIRDWHEALRAPTKSLDVVEGVGHLNLFEAPTRFQDLLARVQRSLESRSGGPF